MVDLASIEVEDVIKEGHLERQVSGLLKKQWKLRYVELTGHFLRFGHARRRDGDDQRSRVLSAADATEAVEVVRSVLA